MAEHVTLNLTRDEAIVFFEWLARFNAEEGRQFEDQAEQRVLWNLEASLESTLVEPLEPDYAQILVAARSRVRDPSE
jgi:hypothetical protein